MTDELLFTVWTGEFSLFGNKLRCHVLNDGRRVIDAEDMDQLLESMANGTADPSDTSDKEEVAKWIKGLD